MFIAFFLYIQIFIKIINFIQQYLPDFSNVYLILAFYVILLFLAVPIAYLFYFILLLFYKLWDYLGEYEKFNKKERKKRAKYFLKIYFYNVILTIPIYFTIENILKPSNSEIISFFFTSLIIIISYLLSFRFLSNPTKKGYFRIFEIYDNESHNESKNKELKQKIRNFKETIKSFYFALTAVTLFYFIIYWLFDLIKPIFDTDASQTSRFISLTNSVPTITPTILIFIGAYLLALFVGTIGLEELLERWEPISDI